MLRRQRSFVYLGVLILLLTSCGPQEKPQGTAANQSNPSPQPAGNPDVSNVAQSYVQREYSQLKPAWLDRFVETGNCDHLGLNHPDWNVCMANIGTWMNHKQNPQLFGPMNFNMPLLDNVATQVGPADVSVQGSTATVLVTVSGTCKFTDDSHSCTNVGELSHRPFQTKVRVTLNGSGLMSKQWQVGRSEEDPQAAQARKQALDADINRIRQREQQAQDKTKATQQLMLAAELDDEPAAVKALADGADPNMSVESVGMRSHFQFPVLNETSLHLAIHYKRVALVRLLLEHGANVDQRGAVSFGRGNDDLTPLREAIMFEQPEIVSLLLAKGADPNLDKPLQDALGCAERSQPCKRIVALLNTGPNPADSYLGPKPPVKDSPYLVNENGQLFALQPCPARISKEGEVTTYNFDGQHASVQWSPTRFPTFYIDYSTKASTDRRERILLVGPLSEKVGRREAQEVPGGLKSYLANGTQVSPTIWRYEAEAMRNGEYWVKPSALAVESSFFCFGFYKL